MEKSTEVNIGIGVLVVGAILVIIGIILMIIPIPHGWVSLVFGIVIGVIGMAMYGNATA
jgi:hypothetical protein